MAESEPRRAQAEQRQTGRFGDVCATLEEPEVTVVLVDDWFERVIPRNFKWIARISAKGIATLVTGLTRCIGDARACPRGERQGSRNRRTIYPEAGNCGQTNSSVPLNVDAPLFLT